MISQFVSGNEKRGFTGSQPDVPAWFSTVELVGLEDWKEGYGLVARGVDGKEMLRSEVRLVWDLLRGEYRNL